VREPRFLEGGPRHPPEAHGLPVYLIHYVRLLAGYPEGLPDILGDYGPPLLVYLARVRTEAGLRHGRCVSEERENPLPVFLTYGKTHKYASYVARQGALRRQGAPGDAHMTSPRKPPYASRTFARALLPVGVLLLAGCASLPGKQRNRVGRRNHPPSNGGVSLCLGALPT
jgi:hypothetical protein